MNKYILGCTLILTFLIGCTRNATVMGIPSEVADEPSLVQAVTPTPPDTPVANSTLPPSIPQTASTLNDDVISVACQLEPVTQPPQPTITFQPNELDTENGLHVTGLPQWIDLATYRLKITGLVDHPLILNYDEIRCMPKITDNPELVCPGVFTDYGSWTGVPIRDVLDLAGVQSEASNLTLISADGYQVKLPIETARAERNFLAYQVNGKPLPIQHGFPLRAVFPDMWGSYWLKWLVEIRIS